jgi:ribosomal protein S18 acetylase RimI-like enzyme
MAKKRGCGGGSMNIRFVTQGDVQAFIGCYMEIWRSLKGVLPDGYVDDQLKRASSQEFHEKMVDEISDPVNILMVATEQAEAIGLAWGNIREDGSSWLAFLGVKPAHRRRGVGGSLLARFIEESRDRGSSKVSLDTDPRLVQAVRLYERTGFAVEGYAENPYGLQLVVYSKDLT